MPTSTLSVNIVTIKPGKCSTKQVINVSKVLKKVAGDENPQLSEAYLRAYAKHAGLNYMDVVNAALESGISVTMTDPIIGMQPGDNVSAEQEALLYWIIRDETSSKETKEWAKNVIMAYFMNGHMAHLQIQKTRLTGYSRQNSAFDYDDMVMIVYSGYWKAIKDGSFNPLTGGKLISYLAIRGIGALQDAINKTDDYIDRHGLSANENKVIRLALEARKAGKTPDVEYIADKVGLIESTVKSIIDSDLTIPTNVSWIDLVATDESEDANTLESKAINMTVGSAECSETENTAEQNDIKAKLDYIIDNCITAEQKEIVTCLFNMGDYAEDPDYNITTACQKLGISRRRFKAERQKAFDKIQIALGMLYGIDKDEAFGMLA
ncbi:MAG: hypothetical protein J5959_08265 [Butyrivibrio sp.]|nr:hypothetical protein [Butyrivibrio sp.]